MAYIMVLNEKGFLTETKFYDPISPEMVGQTVNTHYNENLTLVAYTEPNDENSILLSGQVLTKEQLQNRINKSYGALLSSIASIPEKDYFLLDLRLTGRDQPSYLRLCEAILLLTDPDFVFKKSTTHEKHIISLLNEIKMLLIAASPLFLDKDNDTYERNWFFSIRRTLSAIRDIVEYETIEGSDYELVNSMMSGFNSVLFGTFQPDKAYFEKDDKYF
jgi:hypothetical protein